MAYNVISDKENSQCIKDVLLAHQNILTNSRNIQFSNDFPSDAFIPSDTSGIQALEVINLEKANNTQQIDLTDNYHSESHQSVNLHSLSVVDLEGSPDVNLTSEGQVHTETTPYQQQDFQEQKSVFSSFSNILGLSSATNKETEISVPLPAGIGNIINQENTNVNPVPLFSTSDVDSFGILPPGPPQSKPSTVNTYRRLGSNKKPVYAQVPGLISSNQSHSVIPTHQVTFPFTDSIVPPINQNVQTSSLLNLHFSKPVFTPQLVENTRSPVMASVPASEVENTGLPSSISVEDASTNSFPPSRQDNANIATSMQTYRPVYHHWFFKKEVEKKTLWTPFSMTDSLALEEAFTSNDVDPDKVVATDGGRFDVNILRRQRTPVYWKGTTTEVRRCSWFYRSSTEGKYIPYEENIATKLEDEYKIAFESSQWNRKVALPSGDTIVFQEPEVLAVFPPTQSPDAWGNTPNQTRQSVVKRGVADFDIDEGESPRVDHLLFLIHGIGSVCDLKFRTVEEVVDEFRGIALQLVRSHYRSSYEKGLANRVEVLPIGWHEALHTEETDKKIKSITLDSIPRLRHFTNDTILDVLFYTSPVYSQTIVQAVGNQLNQIYDLFKQRNPSFEGGVSLGGHSLGSLILFDLLCHQHPEPEPEKTTSNDEDSVPPLNNSKPPPNKRQISRRISYMMAAAGTGQPEIQYPHLSFQPKAFFALGSPIGMFVTVRGLNTLGEQFALPTCPAFFNIFHPYDPVAYRIETLVNSELANLKPVLIPHHKGRKRMHLELKETMARVGADLKQRVIDSMKSTWNSFYQFTMFHKPGQTLEEEVNKAFKEQLSVSENLPLEEQEQNQDSTNIKYGSLNKGRRIDYVLQEAPLEFFNEYLFALTSHVCYWESEDTILMILKEIYNNMNISTDSQIPQQTMTIERPPSSPKQSRAVGESSGLKPVGIDPTEPMQANISLGPPPKSGFVNKTSQ